MSSSGLTNGNVGEKTRSWECGKGIFRMGPEFESFSVPFYPVNPWRRQAVWTGSRWFSFLKFFFFVIVPSHPTPSISKESCHGDKDVDYVWAKRWSYFNSVSYIILMETVIVQGSHLAEDYPGFQESHHFWKLSHSTKLESLLCLFRHLLYLTSYSHWEIYEIPFRPLWYSVQ